MSIAIIYPHRNVSDWIQALHTHGPDLKIEVWPDISAPEEVELALCWNHPDGSLQQFPNLKCISSLGAGINQLLDDDSRPTEIPLVRLVDDNLKQSMAEYVMAGVLEQFRRFKDYRQQQSEKRWAELEIPHISELCVGIMGCGEIGRFVGNKLADFGFTVRGWSRTQQDCGQFHIYAGDDELESFLSHANILVCLLPLTPKTENILNLQVFNQLPKNAFLINAARGSHLVEADLLSALESGQLSGALLDVCRQEPLSEQHPFWTHSKISITPHIASPTNPESAAEQIVDNYHRVLSGESLLNLVDIECGY
ncbi:glyoxylate/hydroxypyruvate reductase A [Desulfuromusa kysingii]|uniref:Glyoxylate/hydroxypyruvate reductase A n=1 Tax=Desulfuromusa kysingii TaxID=37625 RepID=A0A1H3W6E7_9BACT|nr:glyoxylate/hydroxypyruvate reductase A [Desulfuromusa kysingii]SDZ82636.1 glyoxylate/hydroxypyruvate reductase A [Desulfuromusa kysingii]